MADYAVSKYSLETQENLSFSLNSVANSQENPHEDDDNPFFDIDFTLPLDRDCPFKNNRNPCADDDDKETKELRFSFSISNSINCPSANQPTIPADNLIYNGQLLPLHVPRSLDMARQNEIGNRKGPLEWSNVNGVKPQFPNLLKTATKLKISRFRLKKSSRVGMDLQADCGRGADSDVQRQSKYFVVKFKKVDVPLFFRSIGDNSRVSKRDERRSWSKKKTEDSQQCKSNERDKKKVKEIVQNYVKMIKPLYLKIFQRNNEKTKDDPVKKSGVGNGTMHSGCSGSAGVYQKQFSFYDKLKMVYKPSFKVGNSSSGVSPAVPKNCSESTVMELQNAIQGAIAHCKRSNCIEDAPTSSTLESSP